MGKTRKSKIVYTEQPCDKWITKKRTPTKHDPAVNRLRELFGGKRRTSNPLLQLEYLSQPIEIVATKQTSLSQYFKKPDSAGPSDAENDSPDLPHMLSLVDDDHVTRKPDISLADDGHVIEPISTSLADDHRVTGKPSPSFAGGTEQIDFIQQESDSNNSELQRKVKTSRRTRRNSLVTSYPESQTKQKYNNLNCSMSSGDCVEKTSSLIKSNEQNASLPTTELFQTDSHCRQIDGVKNTTELDPPERIPSSGSVLTVSSGFSSHANSSQLAAVFSTGHTQQSNSELFSEYTHSTTQKTKQRQHSVRKAVEQFALDLKLHENNLLTKQKTRVESDAHSAPLTFHVASELCDTHPNDVETCDIPLTFHVAHNDDSSESMDEDSQLSDEDSQFSPLTFH